MAKLTAAIIESLYSFGKAVYNREMALEEATDKLLSMYPGEIAQSSAGFYINLYSEYISGKGSTWNQNSALVLYYVENIMREMGADIGQKAFLAGMKYARAKSKKTLIKDLNILWDKFNMEGDLQVEDLYESDFEEWLRNNSEKQYTDNTVRRYIRALKKAEEWLNIKLSERIMSINDIVSFKQIEKEIRNVPEFEKVNQEHGHGDLSAALKAYRTFLSIENNSNELDESGAQMEVTTKEAVERIKQYIAAKGFTYENGLIENFYLSLKSKPFVILAGTSGTGKTRLVKLFAEAIGAEYHLVSVRPDWSDGSDLFGHTDLSGEPVPGPVCSAFEAAQENPNKPVFLCLDEMNLARVEFYLSDFLSVIESREKRLDGRIVTDQIAQYSDGIPDNLYVIGTVNMDETTFPFSKKVLDRANTIEFNYVELMPDFEKTGSIVESLQLQNSFLRTEYLVLARDCEDEREFVVEICYELQKINEILREANAHVGYRVRDEIVFYMLNNKKADNLITDAQAMDNEIMQKILPRIQGSKTSIKEMLVELFKYCVGNHSGLDTESGSIGNHMKSIADSGSVKYPESAKKIAYMMTRYEEDGFTSYWL